MVLTSKRLARLVDQEVYAALDPAAQDEINALIEAVQGAIRACRLEDE